ncbi:hypothetical protein ATN79_20325 [Paraburkholderia caribensis]|nr:hypothetical protein ATN79_20325 [Paraburkholderia caribensis]
MFELSEILAALARHEGPVSREIKLRRVDGTPLHCLVAAARGDQPNTTILGITDVTGVAHATLALEESLRKQAAVYQHMPIGLGRVDGSELSALYQRLRDEKVSDVEAYVADNAWILERVQEASFVIEANKHCALLLGLSCPEELVGRSVGFTWQRRPDTLRRLIGSVVMQQPFLEETQLCTIDGNVIDVVLAATTVMDNGSRHMIVGILDISAKVRAEQAVARMQAEMSHAWRVAVLGEMSASIAHEINQPLAAISVTVGAGERWLEQEPPQLTEISRCLTRISELEQRARNVIARIRDMAERKTPELGEESLSELVKNACAFMAVEARHHHVEIVQEFEPSSDLVRVDKVQIEQVIVNLILNAIQAIVSSNPEVRKIIVSTRTHVEVVECVIVDTGPGIPPGKEKKIFESFFSTKLGGMGIGLSICRSIIEVAGGALTAENGSDGAGARFSFVLPAAPGELSGY